MSTTYVGPVFVAHYASHGHDGTLTGAIHRRIAAPTERTAEKFAKAGVPAGMTLMSVRPATNIDRQAWL